jgi:hypothetical protein
MHGKPFAYRELFVQKWADYVIAHEDWSRMQARFINSQIQNARNIKLTKEQVAKMRETG